MASPFAAPECNVHATCRTGYKAHVVYRTVLSTCLVRMRVSMRRDTCVCRGWVYAGPAQIACSVGDGHLGLHPNPNLRCVQEVSRAIIYIQYYFHGSARSLDNRSYPGN